MTIQAKLQIEFDSCSYTVVVKSIVLRGVHYFFIHDNDNERSFLSGQTLELVYADDFKTAPKESSPSDHLITPDKISVIKDSLLQNRQLWYTPTEPAN